MNEPSYQTHREPGDYEGYSTLIGPHGFQCCLTEPEDRTWGRDLAVAVERLNQQHARIEELTKDCADHEHHRVQNLIGLRRCQAALETVRSDTALHAGCGPTYQVVCEALKTP